ncbi:MAG: flavodoxin family protein [Methanoregulaceae archaeon]|nr:flavodoxin family protein [Methanoregulaceae archaeon]
MQGTRKLLLNREITTANGTFVLSLEEEDLSVLYPGMVRYTVRVVSGDSQVALFRTNTYEYAPAVPLEAGKIAKRTAEEWEAELVRDPAGFASAHRENITRVPPLLPADIIVIQGSPRPGGNCTTMAVWASEAARSLGRTVQLIFPDELDIRPCIGCYQCYNTGACTFSDDMAAVIPAIRGSRLLIVCSPVYTETVPSQLKLLIDRCQAFHAAESFGETPDRERTKGFIIAIAGRKGKTNLTCTKRVLVSFMKNLGIELRAEILIDGLDELRDVSKIPGMKERVKELIESSLQPGDAKLQTES